MEHQFRLALLGWLRAGPELQQVLNAIEEESPVRASPPWLGIATSASADWSTKDRTGREIRLALELQSRGDEAAVEAAIISAIEARIAALPRAQSGFDIVSVQFLRARSERRPRDLRTTLLEYRFRLFETSTE